MLELQERLAVATHVGVLQAMDRIGSRLPSAGGKSKLTVYRWVWLVLIGVLVIAAAAAFLYCRANGYSGFHGEIEFLRGPFGIRIGVKIGCY